MHFDHLVIIAILASLLKHFGILDPRHEHSFPDSQKVKLLVFYSMPLRDLPRPLKTSCLSDSVTNPINHHYVFQAFVRIPELANDISSDIR